MSDDNTTKDADCQFIHLVLAQTKLPKIGSITEETAKHALLEGNWVGPNSIINLFYSIVDHPHIYHTSQAIDGATNHGPFDLGES